MLLYIFSKWVIKIFDTAWLMGCLLRSPCRAVLQAFKSSVLSWHTFKVGGSVPEYLGVRACAHVCLSCLVYRHRKSTLPRASNGHPLSTSTTKLSAISLSQRLDRCLFALLLSFIQTSFFVFCFFLFFFGDLSSPT